MAHLAEFPAHPGASATLSVTPGQRPPARAFARMLRSLERHAARLSVSMDAALRREIPVDSCVFMLVLSASPSRPARGIRSFADPTG